MHQVFLLTNKKKSFTQFNRILTRNSLCSVYRLTRIVYYSPGVLLGGPLWWFTAVLFHIGMRIFNVHQQNICIVFCRLCQHQCSIIQQHNGIPWKIVFFLYMLIYACWSPICVAGPSGLYSGVLLQAHTGTDKNTDTYRDIYQERMLRKN